MSRANIERRLWLTVRAIVMIRDSNQCQKCGIYQEHGLHGSHVFGRGAYQDPYIKYDIQNIKALCDKCHRWWETCDTAKDWFESKHPDRIEYLQKLIIDRKFTGTVSLVDLEEMLVKLKEELKGME